MAFVPGANWGVEDGVFCASFGDQVEQDSPGGVVLQASYSSVRTPTFFQIPLTSSRKPCALIALTSWTALARSGKCTELPIIAKMAMQASQIPLT